MRALVRFPALLLLLAIGCHSGTSSSDVAPSDQTRAKIENRSSLDMDITVSRNDGRSTPLGRVPAGQTLSFALPAGVTTGAAYVRFQARPVRGSGDATQSEPYPVKAGEEISWSISPQ
jgi:hypothetical protein